MTDSESFAPVSIISPLIIMSLSYPRRPCRVSGFNRYRVCFWHICALLCSQNLASRSTILAPFTPPPYLLAESQICSMRCKPSPSTLQQRCGDILPVAVQTVDSKSGACNKNSYYSLRSENWNLATSFNKEKKIHYTKNSLWIGCLVDMLFL